MTAAIISYILAYFLVGYIIMILVKVVEGENDSDEDGFYLSIILIYPFYLIFGSMLLVTNLIIRSGNWIAKKIREKLKI